MVEVNEGELAAVEEGRAFADLSSFRKTLVTGPDARAWLHDLVTADVVGLEEGQARRTLLLSPTGRVRADFQVASTPEGFLLLQDDRQPVAAAELLAPYILSSDIELTDITQSHILVAVLGTAAERVGWPGTSPSVLGPGEDLLATSENAWKIETMMMKKQLTEVGPGTIEIRRIRRGVARFTVDFTEESLPAEGGLEDLIDVSKGCFLGQESVAKVRNLGHPPRVLRHLLAGAPIEVGAVVLAGNTPVGEVTSAAPTEAGGTVLLARIRWEAAEALFTSDRGVPLGRVVGSG